MSSSLSFTGKKWALNAHAEASDTDLATALAEQRGIDLSHTPSFDALCDPMTLGDMSKAIDRIKQAIQNKETVGIIGDYDADGITGTAQLVRFCERHALPHHVILPHRQKHGYGVKKEFIDQMKANNVTLLITVDTGIAYPEEITYAHTQEMDTIVTDHHAHGGTLPDGLILHPTARQAHTNPNLCGSGVVFTLIRGFEGGKWDTWEVDSALAAIGTVADVVSLTGENRMIVQLGLLALNANLDHPVGDLARSVKKEGETITSLDIGFRIAPRINAAGRLDDPHRSLQALLEGNEYIEMLHRLNAERQDSTVDMLEEVEQLIHSEATLLTGMSDTFHPGIVGLLAGRLTEKYGRPSLIGFLQNGMVTCSLRSIDGYDIAAALERCSELLTSYGGHPMAGGCTLLEDDWETFAAQLSNDAENALAGRSLHPTLKIDAEVQLSQVHSDMIRRLDTLGPFGEGNSEPRFIIRNAPIRAPRTVGSDGSHLQCQLGKTQAVGFRLGHLIEQLPLHADIVCRLGINSWKGKENVQVIIEDLADSVVATAAITH